MLEERQRNEKFTRTILHHRKFIQKGQINDHSERANKQKKPSKMEQFERKDRPSNQVHEKNV